MKKSCSSNSSMCDFLPLEVKRMTTPVPKPCKISKQNPPYPSLQSIIRQLYMNNKNSKTFSHKKNASGTHNEKGSD